MGLGDRFSRVWRLGFGMESLGPRAWVALESSRLHSLKFFVP